MASNALIPSAYSPNCTFKHLLEVYPTVSKPMTVGFVHPIIKRLAEIVPRYGWRVTSLFRPGGPHHERGIAMDIAPMVYTVGGAGPRIATQWWDLLRPYTDGQSLLVVAEPAHLHVQLNAVDLVGAQPRPGNLLIATPPYNIKR